MSTKLATRRAFVLLTTLAASGCGDGSGTSPTPPPAGSGFAVFTDPAGGFSTTDVYDVDNQAMRFHATDRTLLWIPDNLLFDGWVVDGNFLAEGRPYQVRFGTVSGQRRAYFTETGRGTICDLQVDNRVLRILPTNSFPP